MTQVKQKATPLTRPGGHPWGTHRVLSPEGVLPQAAQKLDVSFPIYDNEMAIELECLNIDSASFKVLREVAKDNPQKVSRQILEIVRERGKMQNPVTGSGGMLRGRVLQVGPEFPGDFEVGQKVATLVSLTLTPLALEEIESVDLERDQVYAKGRAIIFASGVVAPLPEDMEESLALAVLDVCGAPAWTKRLVQPQDRVLIMGLGKAGILSALAAREVVAESHLFVMDQRPLAESVHDLLGKGVGFLQGDVKRPLHAYEELKNRGGVDFDLVMNTCNTPETETAAILACRPGGKIYFFNMATEFGRAVLTAEGLGKDVQLVMGNGYAPGHWEYALNLVRRHPHLRRMLL
ncbi:MAG: L-erythro-3,5-diaminohexanoate dehydrogenase [bacterium]|nr:L-erythro-3,5-diaminohexanoate dehydrogenase [bacterium]